MNEFARKLSEELASAERHQNPNRLMRITLECGHFRLMPWRDCNVGGIGWSTQCNMCTEDQGRQVSRQIVNQEETGTL